MIRGQSSVRDYKKARRSQLEPAQVRGFAAGLLTGLAVAALAFAYLRATAEQPAAEVEELRPEPRRSEPEGDPAAAAVAEGGESVGQYDFYEMLPKFEVVVPEKDRDVKRDLPASPPVERPGVYVLQAGSYRNLRDAERVRDQLALQGIDAKVQRVAVDSDVWHRVRIGPVSELDALNRLRKHLQAAELDVLVIRVGD